MEIYGLSGQDSVASSLAFVEDLGVGDIEHLHDDTGEIWQRFGIVTQPAWIFINDDGEIDTKLGALGADGMRQALSNLEAN